MMTECTAHTQLKSVYGVSRVMCNREPGPSISMSKVRGPGVEARKTFLSVISRQLSGPLSIKI